VIAANFIAVAARMSLVTFIGIYFVTKAGIDLATVGVAFLCENLARGTLAPVFGALSDRIGRRRLLVVSAAATVIVLPSFLLVIGPLSFIAWSLALGTTGAVNMPVASALLLDLAPPERRQSVLALNYTVISVAYTAAVSPAGFVAERGYGLLAALSASGYVLVACLYALALRGPLPSDPASEAGVARDTLSAFSDRRFLTFAAMACIFPLSMGMVVAVSPLFAASMGLGEGYIGLVLGGNSIVVVLAALPVATRMERSGPFAYLPLSALMVAIGLASYGVINDAAKALLVGTLVFSLGEVVFSSAVPAAVARLAPAGRRGAYQGGWALVQSLAMGSALVLSGALTARFGWQGTWLVFAGLALAAAVAFGLKLRH